MGKQPGCDRKGMEQMGRMLVGIAIGMLIVLVAFFAWALWRVAGDADEQASNHAVMMRKSLNGRSTICVPTAKTPARV